MTTYTWMSFADPNQPFETSFLGVAVVAEGFFPAALRLTRTLNINPGGEVRGSSFSCLPLPDAYLNRLLNKLETEELNAIMQSTQEIKH